MTPPGSDATVGLVGRTREWAQLSVFLGSIDDGGGALLLTGDPGAGKSALLDATAAAARHRGIDVVRCVGTEFEAAIGFAALHQLLHRFLGRIGDVAAPYSAALSAAFGLSDAPPANGLALSSASFDMLHVASGGATLVIVDDVQWVDPASAEVLAIMSRRTEGTRTGILLARRTGTAALFEQERLPELRVDALSPAASKELLAREHPSLDPEVVRRVLDASDGNPLALLELPRVVANQSAPTGPVDALALTDRLQRAFEVQIADLPRECRRLLLLAVLDGSDDPALLQRAAEGQRWLDSLEPAARQGLVRIGTNDTSLRLRHPLTGAAVVTMASSEERRDAHRAIAELSDDPDRRTWHAGEAADGPDDEVAMAMERAGQRWLQRGDTAGAVQAWVRAGRLSSRFDERARRLSMAASHAALRTTSFRASKDLLTEALVADPSLRGSLDDASVASFFLVNTDGDIEAAHRLLADALSDVSAGVTPIGELENALTALGVVSLLGERAQWWQRFHDLVALMGSDARRWWRGVDCLSADPAHRGSEVIAELDAQLQRIGIDDSPDLVLNLAVCSFWVDRLSLCHSALLSVWESADGEMTSLTALMYVCVAEYQMGDWEAAVRHAAAGLRRCAETSANIYTWQFQLIQGLVAAGQGDIARAVSLADAVERWVRPRGIGFGMSAARQLRMSVAWAQGDTEDAHRHATAISAAGALRSHAPRALFVAFDVVESAVRTGRHVDAVAHVEVLRAAQVERLSPRLAMIRLACEALISHGDEALERFESALAIEDADRSPLDFARVHLAFGEALRRQRAETTRSREHLREAATIFRALGAQPWATRAEAELRATGETRSARDRSRSKLTVQELQIARLAAAGMRNKEIGAELFLSPRTVSAHLYRIFPKLGITSRAALRDALSELGDVDDS